jgi:hypothetical protein
MLSESKVWSFNQQQVSTPPTHAALLSRSILISSSNSRKWERAELPNRILGPRAMCRYLPTVLRPACDIKGILDLRLLIPNIARGLSAQSLYACIDCFLQFLIELFQLLGIKSLGQLFGELLRYLHIGWARHNPCSESWASDAMHWARGSANMRH